MCAHSSTLVVLVGLPARGKTFIASRLTRYLNWTGLKTKIFNVGSYRREMTTAKSPKQDAQFFDPNNVSGQELRSQFVNSALKDLIEWLNNEPGRVAVLDATNTTRKRRQFVLNAAKTQVKFQCNVFFIESICNDQNTIDKTVLEVKLHGKDYSDTKDKDTAIKDFLERIEMYKKAYEPLDEDIDDELSFIKNINVGQKFLVNRVKDHVQSKIVYYLMNAKVGRGRSIYLTRHGESEFNVLGRIGGNSNLSPRGQQYAGALGRFVNEKLLAQGKSLKIWCSELVRTQQTAQFIDHEVEPWKALNEINAGVCEGMTYEEISERYPHEFKARDEDKYNYRYQMGESYYDIVTRLEPVIMELERYDDVLVICHQAVMRCLLSYFLDKSCEELPYQKCELHTIYRLEPKAYGCEVEKIQLGIDAVDTHRALQKAQSNEEIASYTESLENHEI